MSHRSLVELNHDFFPNDTLLPVWAEQMQTYIRSGDPADLPYGVTFKGTRHHSDPEFSVSEYPKPCGICSGVIQSEDDFDWHGYGNCRDIPEGEHPEPALTKEEFLDNWPEHEDGWTHRAMKAYRGEHPEPTRGGGE